MTKAFKSNTEAIPETSYLQAKQEWDFRIGNNVIRAKNWRFITLLVIVLNLLLAIGLIMAIARPKYIPYVVEVTDGVVKNVTPIAKQKYVPTKLEFKSHLVKFIENIRSISTDHQVNQKRICEAYAFLSSKVANKLDEHFTKMKKDEKFQSGMSTTVTVNSFVQMADKTYQLQWQEQRFNEAGKLLATTKWVGFVTIQMSIPSSEEAILYNPLGILLTDFSWSEAKELA